MDHNVEAAITAGLRRRGVDVVTAFEDGTAAWDDGSLFERLAGLGRVLFSRDRDFFAIAARWTGDGREFPGLVYAPKGRVPIGQAVDDLELIASAYDPDEMRDRVVFLPLS